VQGRVWFTAHVVAVALACGYLATSIEARYPLAAGLCLGLAAVTRTPMAFLFPLFLCEAWRVAAGDGRRFLVLCARFLAPVMVIAMLAMLHNYARFSEAWEFGHSYLAVRQQERMETIGQFSHQYLSRNLAVALTLLPTVTSTAPFLHLSGHGLALWFTTPLLLLLLWPRQRTRLHRPLWLCVALAALPSLLYHNSGWLQFGYRFSLDYVVFLIALLAIGGRPLGRGAKALILCGVLVNAFGAVTFARYMDFYDLGTYGVVIPH
jgi:hypothetical protein